MGRFFKSPGESAFGACPNKKTSVSAISGTSRVRAMVICQGEANGMEHTDYGPRKAVMD